MARQLKRAIKQMAAPLTEEEMNSANAAHARATRLMISSLGPPPVEMNHQQYMNWANQQLVEPFPGVVLPFSAVAAPITKEEMDFLNDKMVDFMPHNVQIIAEPEWYLTGAQRRRITLDGTELESYKCSDGTWRMLKVEELESARRRTSNLQAPIRAAIPRPAAVQMPVHQTTAVQTPVRQTTAVQTPVQQTTAVQTPVVRATAYDAPVANGQFGNASSQTAHFQ